MTTNSFREIGGYFGLEVEQKYNNISGSIALREKGDLKVADDLISEGLRRFQIKNRLKMGQILSICPAFL